jgi:hypothetical protein
LVLKGLAGGDLPLNQLITNHFSLKIRSISLLADYRDFVK